MQKINIEDIIIIEDETNKTIYKEKIIEAKRTCKGKKYKTQNFIFYMVDNNKSVVVEYKTPCKNIFNCLSIERNNEVIYKPVY